METETKDTVKINSKNEQQKDFAPEDRHSLSVDLKTEARDFNGGEWQFKSREWNGETFELASVGTWELNLSNQTLRCNQVFEDILGLQDHPEERKVQEIESHIRDEDLIRLRQELKMALKSHQPCDSLVQIVDGKNISKWLCIRGSVIYDQAMRPLRVVGIAHDVTASMAAARKQKESKFQLLQVSDFLPQLVWTMNQMGEVDYVNDNWFSVTGLDFQEVKEGKWVNVIHPEDRERTQSIRSSAIQRGEAHEIELRIHSLPDDQYRWFLWRCVPYYGRDRKLEKWFGTLTDIHEQKASVLKVLDSEAKLKAVASSAPIILWVLDRDLRCVLAEGKSLDLFFDNLKEIVGTPYGSIFGENSSQLVNARRALAGESFVAIEPTGDRVSESHYTPVRDSAQKVTGVMTVSIDITERREYEKSLILSEAKYRYLFACNPQPMWMFDLQNLTFIEVNDAAIAKYGFSREEFMNMTILDILPEAEKIAFKDGMKKSSSFTKIASLNTRHLKKDGTAIDVEILAHDVCENGKKARLILAHDITQHKMLEFALDTLSQAGLALSASLDFSQTLKALAQLAVPRLGEWCSIDLFNEKGSLVRNLMFQNGKKAEVGEICPSEHCGREVVVGPVMKNALESQRPQVLKHRSAEELKKMGPPLADPSALYDMICVPLVTRGETLGILTVVRDARIHPLSEEVLQLIIELGNRAAFAIENAKLYLAAQKASEAKSLFLANISHEMRTPLGIIHGFSELALEPQLPIEERLSFIATIKKNTEQLTKLINDVLDLSKIEADRLEIEAIEFSIKNLMKEIADTLSPKAAEKNLRLSFSISEQLPEYLISDPTKIRQIFTNVVGNAIKFTERGQVEVSVSPIFSSDRDSLALEVLIKDTGIGMTMEQTDKLFQPFSQADVSMTRRFGGTGLGLLISKKLARALGGDLEIHWTEPGQGSVFKLVLKAKLPKSVMVSKTTEASRPRGERPLEGMKVLVVEDAPDNQALISRYLKAAGADVQVANDGAEGVSKALHDSCDAILMDIQMPVMDGYEALHQLQEAHFERPVIALTAHAMREERDHALQEGFAEYLTKPISRSNLLDVLKEIKEMPQRGSTFADPRA